MSTLFPEPSLLVGPLPHTPLTSCRSPRSHPDCRTSSSCKTPPSSSKTHAPCPQPSPGPCPAFRGGFQPLLCLPLLRLSPSLEAAPRTVWRTHRGHLGWCLSLLSPSKWSLSTPVSQFPEPHQSLVIPGTPFTSDAPNVRQCSSLIC